MDSPTPPRPPRAEDWFAAGVQALTLLAVLVQLGAIVAAALVR